jgi:transposase, IS30 family
MKYRHLDQKERDELAVLRSQGLTLRAIAQRMGRSYSSLSRELWRNKGQYGYFPHTAQKRAEQRLRLSHRSPRMKNSALRQEVWRLLERRWSPELISGRLKMFRPDLPSISAEAIYQWIYEDRRDLIRYLARSRPKRWPRKNQLKSRIQIPGRVSVHLRPLEAQDRSQAGHWETDLLVGSGAASLQVIVERTSRYSCLRKVPNKTAATCRSTLTYVMDSIPAHLRRSITYDNGPENKEHRILNEDFELQSYFCEPYHSWEKGTVENTNGLIRRFIPKQTRLEDVPEETIRHLEAWLNNRPRKVLKFRTPREAFSALCCT